MTYLHKMRDDTVLATSPKAAMTTLATPSTQKEKNSMVFSSSSEKVGQSKSSSVKFILAR